nr:hypothetical protein BN993_02356 [Virgibacillus halodenitrificans]
MMSFSSEFVVRRGHDGASGFDRIGRDHAILCRVAECLTGDIFRDTPPIKRLNEFILRACLPVLTKRGHHESTRRGQTRHRL